MIYITKKKFNRIINNIKINIFNNIQLSGPTMCEMSKYKLWKHWTEIVIDQFKSTKSLTKARKLALPIFIKKTKKLLI